MTSKQIHIMYWVIIALIIGIFVFIILDTDKPALDENDLKIREMETLNEELRKDIAIKDSLLVISNNKQDSLRDQIDEKEVIYIAIPQKYDKERNIVLSLSDSASVGYLSSRLNKK